MLYYQKSVEESLESLKSDRNGLSSYEARTRLKTHGQNVIKVKGEPFWRKIIEPFANIFIAVLAVAVIVSVVQKAYVDAIIILAIIFVSAVIYYIQRFSTERILRSLQRHSSQVVDVIRSGKPVRINAALLVPGDIINLAEGDKVPADIRVISASNVRVDEAMLTGESEPISKSITAIQNKREIYEQSNILFSGSFVISGEATGVVIFTGNNTEFGRIATLTSSADTSENSPVQKKIDKLIAAVIAVVGAVSVVAFFLAISRGIEAGEALRFVIALAVSAVPESLPIAISVVLVLGMRRMAAKKALVRSMKAIETIGVVTTIATDKTGTLTENKLSIQEIWQPDWSKDELHKVAFQSMIYNGGKKTHDPLDVAINRFTKADSKTGVKNEAQKLATLGSIASTLPFEQAFAMSGNVWLKRGLYELAVKGAPESIIERCKLSESQRTEVEESLKSLTSQGYRVIAVASMPLRTGIESFKEIGRAPSFKFVGLLAVADTLRPAARKAITAAQNAGVTVRMITGDHLETAYSIGMKLGLIQSRSQIFDSRKMESLSNKELAKTIKDIRIFSRVTPENKFRILEVLRLKEVTAMTGDGVNDVPALANAHVGISMGSGTQIAKDAGDIILLNDNFASIVSALREGRIIFANVKRMLVYLLSTNIGEVIVSLGALIIGLPMPLHAVQILWTNLMTDTAMAIPLGLEPGERDVMQRKPTAPSAPLFSRYLLARMIITATTMGSAVLATYIIYLNSHGVDYARTLAFSSLVVIQWASAFNARSTYESIFTRLKVWVWPFYIGLAIAITVQAIAFFGPLQSALHIHPVAIGDIFLTGLISFVAMIVVVEIHKLAGRRSLAGDS